MRQNNVKIFKIFRYGNNDNRKKFHGKIQISVKSENAFLLSIPKSAIILICFSKQTRTAFVRVSCSGQPTFQTIE
jgi:hypothetical protein